MWKLWDLIINRHGLWLPSFKKTMTKIFGILIIKKHDVIQPKQHKKHYDSKNIKTAAKL